MCWLSECCRSERVREEEGRGQGSTVLHAYKPHGLYATPARRLLRTNKHSLTELCSGSFSGFRPIQVTVQGWTLKSNCLGSDHDFIFTSKWLPFCIHHHRQLSYSKVSLNIWYSVTLLWQYVYQCLRFLVRKGTVWNFLPNNTDKLTFFFFF